MGGTIQRGGAAALLWTTALAGCVLWSGCSLFDEPVRHDLANNEYIYQPTNYVAPRRAAAAVFIMPLKDRRKLPDVNKGAGYRQIFTERHWDRAVPVMVEEVLVDAVDKSQIFGGVSTGTAGRPKRSDYVLEPTLAEMYRMLENPTGIHTGKRRTVAVTQLKLRLLGPVDRIGKRPVLLDEPFQEIAGTRPRLGRADLGFVLAGQTVQNIFRRALPRLYETSVALPEPAAEASAPKKK